MEHKPVKKNEEYKVEIIDQGTEGEGIAKIDGFTIFVPETLKGESVRILIVKVLSSHAFGKVTEILKQSPYRTSADCQTYPRCGGCKLRHVAYEETLRMKQEKVQNLAHKMLKQKIVVDQTVGMEHPFHYRNKLQYPLGINKANQPVMGVYAQRTHEIIPTEECFLQNPISEKIAKTIFQFITQNNLPVYNEKTGEGVFRHIVIKIAVKTEEVMCILVVNKREIPKEQELIENLLAKFPTIKTIVKNINAKNTNVILGKENEVLYGSGVIEDKLGNYYFKISPLSFYQVNPIQTEKLYTLGIEKADLQGDEIALDLYCGIGTIGIFASSKVKKVYGIEIIEEAVKDAKENAKRNQITNAEFYAGDVEQILDHIIETEHIKPDVAFVDPPRKGLDNVTIENLLKRQLKKIIYISCNPATLMRDLAKLEDQYIIHSITPVDMFPYTAHIETVTLLTLKNQ